MQKLTIFSVLSIAFAVEALGQGNATIVLSLENIQKQQSDLSSRIIVLRGNFTTFWLEAYPKGAPFATRDHEQERIAAWNPPPDGSTCEELKAGDMISFASFARLNA